MVTEVAAVGVPHVGVEAEVVVHVGVTGHEHQDDTAEKEQRTDDRRHAKQRRVAAEEDV
jgi:hypothetical protein